MYPKLANAKMAPCQAIVKNTYYPCSNLARNGHDTCASHKKFFHEQTWKNRFLYANQDEYVGVGNQEGWNGYRLEQHVRSTLVSGRFSITEEDVRAIPCDWAFTDIFLMLCELPSVNPTWNKRLLLATIGYYINLHQNITEVYGLDNPYELHTKRIRSILTNPHMTFGQTLKFMLKAKEKRDMTHSLMHLPPESHKTIFDMLFLDYKDEYIWYSDEFLTTALVPTQSQIINEYFKKELLPQLKRRAAAIRQAKKMRLDPMKEELVSVVYHPNNVEKWLNAGGWDLLDTMF